MGLSPRGYSGFQVTVMIEWGKNQNQKISLDQKLTPKKPHAKFLSLTNFSESINLYNMKNKNITPPGSIRGPIKNLQILDRPNKTLLKSSHPKQIILAKFSFPKKIPELKISNPKKSFDRPCHLKSQVPPPEDINYSQAWSLKLLIATNLISVSKIINYWSIDQMT